MWIRNEVFPGDRQDHLPDLMVNWNNETSIHSLESPRFGLVEGENPDPRPGTHSSKGFLVAGGAGIPKGSRGSGHLTDVAPTILELLGLKPSADMDGRLLDELTPSSMVEEPHSNNPGGANRA